jgi:glutamate synthase (NADPH) large chain
MTKKTKVANQGLYSPTFEHDSCGIGFVASINGIKTNQTLRDALTMLENMEHRGGKGSSPKTNVAIQDLKFQLPASMVLA